MSGPTDIGPATLFILLSLFTLHDAPYPSDQVSMDLTLGLPQFATFDYWWVYAWFNSTNPLLIVAIVSAASLLTGAVGYELWATLAKPRHRGSPGGLKA